MSEYTLFTLLKKDNTEELHLFHSKMSTQCIIQRESICGRMESRERSQTIFACLDEDEARQKCADLGRQVCGTCIGNLYADL